jgi:elongation factor Ts
LSTSLIAKLRKETSLSLAQCKKALDESQNDYNRALQWLCEHEQQIGADKAEKLKNRTAKEGWVSVYLTDHALLLTEINCETDFVARNDVFHHLIQHIHQQAMQHRLFSNVELVAHPSVQQVLYETIARLGENIQLRRIHLFEKHHKDDIFGHFIHGSQAPYVCSGRIAAFIRAPPSLSPLLARQLAQHVVGMNPSSKEEWLNQPFLFDTSKIVADIIRMEHQSIDFLRCECGGNYTHSSC